METARQGRMASRVRKGAIREGWMRRQGSVEGGAKATRGKGGLVRRMLGNLGGVFVIRVREGGGEGGWLRVIRWLLLTEAMKKRQDTGPVPQDLLAAGDQLSVQIGQLGCISLPPSPG